MNKSARTTGWALASALAPLAALSQDAPASGPPGYDVEKSQSVQTAPPGSVGRKTTDREHRVGNGEDVLGNELTYVLTFGGFARQCPDPAGKVGGDFEYSITYDAVDIDDDGEISREHRSRRLLLRLEGQVEDDAHLKDVEYSGSFSIERSGTAIEPTSSRVEIAPRRFTPGPAGEPDIAAMVAAVEVTADVAIASAILMAGTIYRDAEATWRKLNECVELSFDPPTDTEQLASSQSRQVRADLRTKADGTPVPWMSENINAIRGIGTVEPRRVDAADSASVTLTYTASNRPRRGHGVDLAATSKAGIANSEWRIVDRYEGTFTQVDKAEGSFGVVTSNDSQTVSGRLVWTSDNAGAHAASFGDVPSAFYKATGGELTVEVSSISTGVGGSSCETRGRETFALPSLNPSVSQYLLLEIAADGRYKLILATTDYPPTPWQADSVCTFPGAGSTRQETPAALPSVVIGIQEGRLNADQAVIGEMAPLRRGPRTITGNWSFSIP